MDTNQDIFEKHQGTSEKTYGTFEKTQGISEKTQGIGGFRLFDPPRKCPKKSLINHLTLKLLS